MIEKLLRAVGIFKGKQRIARILLRSKIESVKDLVVTAAYGCSYKVPNIKENIGFELYINGVFEHETLQFIMKRLPENGLLIDLGANIGSISIPICKQRPDVKALCVEASPKVFSYLEYNVRANQLLNCNIVNKAISDADEQEVSFFSPIDKFGKGSMANVFKSNTEKIKTARLDTLVQQYGFEDADFIKVDIEGFEYFAFHGGPNLLSKSTAPDILFEFMDWAEESTGSLKAGAAQALLLQYGYILYTIAGNGLRKMDAAQYSGDAMIYATKKMSS